MLAQELAQNQTSPTTWLVVGVGVTVAASVYGLLGYVRRLRRLRAGSREVDLSWEDLLEKLRLRRREREKAGPSADEDLLSEELFKELLSTLPAGEPNELAAALEDLKSQALGLGRGPADAPEDLRFLTQGGVERRADWRRWGNPTEVHLTLPHCPDAVHGLVINRSTGGLAVLLQQEVSVGTSIQVRPVEAPRSVPFINVEVRHCRKAGRLCLIGCQFCEEVPWNVRFWFG
jgi:hypothetical protein